MLFIAIPLIILLTLVSTYNSLVKQRNRLDEKFATMDIYLTKRHALIPSLVSVVKGYAKHESQTLSEVAQARNLAQKAHGSEQQIKEENMLSRGITNLFAIVERYPELKADKQFISLQQELIKIEEEIANTRKEYNEFVRRFNNRVQTFPTHIIAKIFKFKKRDMFVASVIERENVKVDM